MNHSIQIQIIINEIKLLLMKNNVENIELNKKLEEISVICDDENLISELSSLPNTSDKDKIVENKMKSVKENLLSSYSQERNQYFADYLPKYKTLKDCIISFQTFEKAVNVHKRKGLYYTCQQ